MNFLSKQNNKIILIIAPQFNSEPLISNHEYKYPYIAGQFVIFFLYYSQNVFRAINTFFSNNF